MMEFAGKSIADSVLTSLNLQEQNQLKGMLGLNHEQVQRLLAEDMSTSKGKNPYMKKDTDPNRFLRTFNQNNFGNKQVS